MPEEEVTYPPLEAPPAIPTTERPPMVMTTAPGEPGVLPHEQSPDEGLQTSAIEDPSAPKPTPVLKTTAPVKPPDVNAER